MRIHLKFTRKAQVEESGGVSIDHDDPSDWAGIMNKACRQEFKEFLVSAREYKTEDWTFEPLPEPLSTRPKEKVVA